MPSKKGQLKKEKSQLPTKRRVKRPEYKSFKYSKRLHQTKPPIKGAFRLFYASVRFLFARWRLFGGIILVYIFLTIILVNGFTLRSSGMFSEPGSSGSDPSGAYRFLLWVIISLVTIWAIRKSSAEKEGTIKVKEAFYKGLYPFVPFILVLLVVSLQLLPLIIANYFYAKVIIGGIAVTVLEKTLWFVFFILLSLLSLYMVSSSLFALYIVTLPDVKPMQALKSARDLVKYRRSAIMRKVLFLPVALLVIAGIVVVPAIAVSANTAEYLFFLLGMAMPAVAHSYFYHLYRELL